MSTLGQAKRDFKIGYLKGFSIYRDISGAGWNIDLEDINARHSFIVDARTKSVRVFKTVDACVSTLQDIGFEVKVLRP